MLFPRVKKITALLLLLFLAACGAPANPPAPTATPHTAPLPLPAGQSLSSGGDPIKFDKISVEQGLSQGSVHAMLQDSQGFMWFGTGSGLNKYDGYHFSIYENDPLNLSSLSRGAVLSLCEDSAGVLWVGTDGGGLNRYDRKTNRFTYFINNPADPHSISHNVITQILEDSSGILWVGTGSGGLNRYERSSGQFFWYRRDSRNPASLSSDTVSALYEDAAGRLWVGTPQGLDLFDRSNGTFKHYTFFTEDRLGPEANHVTTIISDSSGMLWIGTAAGGLIQMDPDHQEVHFYQYDRTDPNSLSSNTVWGILEDHAGTLWVATQDGLNQFDRVLRRFYRYRTDPLDPNSLADNVLWSIYEDQSGVIWLGTGSQGLSKINPSRQLFAHYRHDPANPTSLLDSNVTAIFEDHLGVMWIGDAGGLEKWDRKASVNPEDATTPNRSTAETPASAGQFVHYQYDPLEFDSLGGTSVSAIFEDSHAQLWVGFNGSGLDLFDRVSGKFTHFRYHPYLPGGLSNDTIRALNEDSLGYLWIATWGGGLNQMDPVNSVFTIYRHQPGSPSSLASDNVYTVYIDRSGAVWVGTDAGLDLFDRASGSFTHFKNDLARPDSLSSNKVTSIFEDSSGVLWVGTATGGLNRFDSVHRTFTRFSEKDGLPGSAIDGILQEISGALWLSTNRGIARFDPINAAVKTFGTQHGLQGREFNAGACYMSHRGEMFFGGANGLNVFYPEQVRENPNPPLVVLTSLTQGGEEVEPGRPPETIDKVTLYWPHNYFEFEFAALSYRQPESNSYAYELEGFDAQPVRIGTRRNGRYTNLPGRTYTLRLTAANDDGVWNDVGRSITIEVVPPFWETWWFISAAALALVLAAFGANEMRVRGMRNRSRQLAVLVEQRTAQLRSEIDQRTKVEEALRQIEMEKAIAAERSRLARDLHDAVTQTLFSASLIAEALPNTWKSDPVEGRKLLDELRLFNRGALAEMRTLLLELRPSVLVDANLGDLMRQLGEAIIGREGIQVQVTTDVKSALPQDVHIAFYRVAQEALNNVARHARAEHAWVNLNWIEEPPIEEDDQPRTALLLTVEDDGCGFDPAKAPTDHMGLKFMRERAQSIGGEVIISPRQPCGTIVSLKWVRP